MTLLKPSQMAALQKYAARGLKTPITIMRASFSESGDDDQDEPVFNVIGTTKGWFHQVPFEHYMQDYGVVMAMTDVISVPIGTDIATNDRISSAHTGYVNEYVIVDVTDDETWPLMLQCTIRSRS